MYTMLKSRDNLNRKRNQTLRCPLVCWRDKSLIALFNFILFWFFIKTQRNPRFFAMFLIGYIRNVIRTRRINKFIYIFFLNVIVPRTLLYKHNNYTNWISTIQWLNGMAGLVCIGYARRIQDRNNPALLSKLSILSSAAWPLFLFFSCCSVWSYRSSFII